MALPSTMRAAVYRGPRDLAVEDRPVPEPGPNDVILKVEYCGVCGSDIHFVLDGWGTPGTVEGHEYSGRVVAVGSDVSRWNPGDEVVGGPSLRCGECRFCLAGRPSLCTGRSPVGEGAHSDGAFAEYTSVHEDELLALPEGMSLRTAALAEPLAVSLHALTLGGVDASSRVLVTGAGPIGALAVAAARARGVADIVVSEPAPLRRDLAERLGARTVTPDQLVAPLSPNEVVDDPFDVALECSGRSAAMEGALGQLGRTGTLVLVGAGMEYPRFDSNRILLNELVVTGAFTYDAGGFDHALELLGSDDFPADVLIEPTPVDLDRLLGAIEGLAAGDVAAKVMVRPRDLDGVKDQGRMGVENA